MAFFVGRQASHLTVFFALPWGIREAQTTAKYLDSRTVRIAQNQRQQRGQRILKGDVRGTALGNIERSVGEKLGAGLT